MDERKKEMVEERKEKEIVRQRRGESKKEIYKTNKVMSLSYHYVSNYEVLPLFSLPL